MLGGFIVIVLIMVVGAVFLTRAMSTLMGRLGGGTIDKLHRSAEHILENGTVPPLWLEVIRRRGIPPDRARARCLKQMKKLIRYFERSPAVVVMIT